MCATIWTKTTAASAITMNMLEIIDLHVSIGGTPVLKGVNLTINAGETFILFGPNGSGTTSLLMTLMGVSGYEVTQGQILFKGQDITRAPMYERARLGIGLSFQRPPTIRGLPTGKLVELCARNQQVDIPAMAKKLNFDTFLDRDVNAGFSGGEIKRSELLQLMAQRPDLILFDEPESGVDLENMALVGNTVHELLEGEGPKGASLRQLGRVRHTCGLIITHTGYILQYVNAHRGQVLYHGKLCCEANPHEILQHIQKHGYHECLRCLSTEDKELRS